jgi:hypothetical protein
MKKIFIPLVLLLLAATVLPAQELNLSLAVTTQEMDREMLRDLGLGEEEIGEITALQERFREMTMETLLERNVIKAQLARELHNADADEEDINRMLERASELRLEQEQAQVRTYLQIRQMLGEENWSELIRRIRVQARINQRLRDDDPAGPQGNRAAGNGAAGSDPRRVGGSGSGNSARN